MRHDSFETLLAAGLQKPTRRTFWVEILDRASKRGFDAGIAAALLLILLPVIVIVAVAIKLESRGPVFYRCRRLGRHGSELRMLKFRKMHDGATGPALVGRRDERFTRLGPFLARTKLDELPQLWNVLLGQMSLVGPRPEDETFIRLHKNAYREILKVRPGITGFCQLAFAREREILADADRERDYIERLLPQKVSMDLVYVRRRAPLVDLSILCWTAVAIVLRKDVAVHRETGRLSLRAPRAHLRPAALERTTA